MALIRCPECNKEISDKANICIHCGYPISSDDDFNNNPLNNNLKYCIIFKRLGFPNKLNAIKEIKNLAKIGLAEAFEIVDKPPSIIAKNISLNEANFIKNKLDEIYVITEIEPLSDNPSSQEIESILDKHRENIVRCPRCGSSSITTGQRGFSLLTGFLGSNKTVNRCGSCGWTWEPRK